jgi:hypothetical protein
VKPSRRIDEPPFPTAGSNSAADARPEETLIADKRSGLTLADIVEGRFWGLLHGSALKVGMPRLCLPRADGRTARTIEYPSIG